VVEASVADIDRDVGIDVDVGGQVHG